MENLKEENIIKKWLKNELSAKERVDFETLKDAKLLEEIIFEAKRFTPEIKLDPKSAPMPKSQKKTVLPLNLNVLYRVAAVLVIAFGLFRMLVPSSGNQIQIYAHEQQTLNLPDRSVVRLNEASHISYKENSWDTKRSLTLDGEAFFEVAKGKKFDVITPHGVVSVLGTAFNVNARNNTFTVSCFEGKVRVDVSGEKFLLTPGQKIEWKGGIINQLEEVKHQPVWLSGLYTFQEVPLHKVLIEMARHYNVTFDTTAINDNVLFSGAFESDSLKNALEAITQPLRISYELKSQAHVILTHVEN